MKLHNPIPLKEMAELLLSKGMKAELRGENRTITGIDAVEQSKAGDITIAVNEKFLSLSLTATCSAVVIPFELETALDVQASLTKEKSFLLAENPALAHAFLKQAYADWDFFDTTEWGQIHPSAVIHAEAKVDPTAAIGPNVVIGRGAQIGAGTALLAGVVVEAEAIIGTHTVLHPNVVIGRQCIVGNNCQLKPGCVIGGEGFGFAQDRQRKHHRLPQTGIVVIEDNCVLGSGNCIDRAAYGQTIIRSGVIMDNLCHIAHNVVIGEDSIIAGQTGIAGSTKLGRRVVCTGQTGFLDHLTIADDAVFLLRPAITENVDSAGVYAGNPLLPITGHHRMNANLKNLTQMSRDLKAMQKRIAELEARLS